MLRINLLPTRERESTVAEGSSLQSFLIMLVVTLVLVTAAAIFVHAVKQRELETANHENTQLENQVRAIRARVADHDRVRADLAEIRAREEAITRLESARTGPASMLIELSHILTPVGLAGGHPQICVEQERLEALRRDSPHLLPNDQWDPTNLWLTDFTEAARNVTIEGTASSDGDVSEFMRRLMLSCFFENVTLISSLTQPATTTTVQPLHSFKLTAKVRY